MVEHVLVQNLAAVLCFFCVSRKAVKYQLNNLLLLFVIIMDKLATGLSRMLDVMMVVPTATEQHLIKPKG